MNGVIRIRDKKTGEWKDITVIKGDNGKSAYQQAVDGGFEGTEEEFVALLNGLAGTLDARHVSDFSNPHNVTAEQVKSLKFYNGFAGINTELGTSFDVTTPIETIIQAMPNNTGFIGDINTVDKGETSYPAIYGILTIYKIRDNRVQVEYVSNTATGSDDYNTRWLGQYNAGVFGGFVEVLTDANLPTAEQVGAFQKKVLINGKDVLGIVTDGWYYSTESINVPTTGKNGYVTVMTNADGGYRVVTWQERNDITEYTNVLFEGKWLGWTEIFTNKGGTLTGSLGVNGGYGKVSADPNNVSISAYNVENNPTNRRNIMVLNSNYAPTLGNAVQFRSVVDDVEKDYKIYGEHNKPTVTYNGSGQTATKAVNVGGVGNVLMITSPNGMALVTSAGAWWKPTNNTNMNGVIANECNYTNGVLTLHTTVAALNMSGTTYTVQVL